MLLGISMSKGEQQLADVKQMWEPIVLTPEEVTEVSGGGSNVRHGNPGGGPAPYNVHTTAAGAGPAWYNVT